MVRHPRLDSACCGARPGQASAPGKALTLVKAAPGRSVESRGTDDYSDRHMSVQQIDRSGKVFFDSFTKSLAGKRAEIEVASLDIGDQIEAAWAPLIGMAYDRKDDLVEVTLEGIDHLIGAPREVYVDHDVGGTMSVQIVDSDGTSQIVKLREPLALPAPDKEPAA